MALCLTKAKIRVTNRVIASRPCTTQFDVTSPGLLSLCFKKSPATQAFKGFAPKPETQSREFRFSLTKEECAGVEANAGPFRYYWEALTECFPIS